MLMFLLACHIEQVSDCLTDEHEVADDDALDALGFTVADLVAQIAGVRTFPASLDADTIVDTQLTLVRGEGVAVFADREWETHEELRPGLFYDQDLMLRTCDDRVTVPFEVELTTSDGSVDFAGDAEAFSEPWGDTAEGVGGVGVYGNVSEDGEITPQREGVASDGTLSLYFEGPNLYQVDASDGATSVAFPTGATPD